MMNHRFMVTILKLNNNRHKLAPRGQTINKEYYVEVLKRLRDAVRRKRPRFWSSGNWLLHHDNAPAHSSNLVQQFLTKHKIVQLRQPVQSNKDYFEGCYGPDDEK